MDEQDRIVVQKMKMCFSIQYGHNLMNEMEIIDNVDKIRDLAKKGSIDLMATRGKIHLYIDNTDILADSYSYDIHRTIDLIFYMMKDLENEPIEVSLPSLSVIIQITPDTEDLSINIVRNKEMINSDLNQTYTFPKREFLFEIAQFYWRKARIFYLIGKPFPILGKSDDFDPDLDQVTVLDFEKLVLNWQKYTPLEIFNNEEVEKLKYLMDIPVREWVMSKNCS